MSYDLHGTWDSSNPIGPYVYAHTNLTEIKLALDLFWREGISPDAINLGLAFYGRSFKLKDPSCSDPGCGFEGPGDEGRCTDTPGILSYREINELRGPASTFEGSFTVHDKEAGVNYMVYGENQENCESTSVRLGCALQLIASFRGLLRHEGDVRAKD